MEKMAIMRACMCVMLLLYAMDYCSGRNMCPGTGCECQQFVNMIVCENGHPSLVPSYVKRRTTVMYLLGSVTTGFDMLDLGLWYNLDSVVLTVSNRDVCEWVLRSRSKHPNIKFQTTNIVCKGELKQKTTSPKRQKTNRTMTTSTVSTSTSTPETPTTRAKTTKTTVISTKRTTPGGLKTPKRTRLPIIRTRPTEHTHSYETQTSYYDTTIDNSDITTTSETGFSARVSISNGEIVAYAAIPVGLFGIVSLSVFLRCSCSNGVLRMQIRPRMRCQNKPKKLKITPPNSEGSSEEEYTQPPRSAVNKGM